MKAFRLKLGLLFTYIGNTSESRIGPARLSLLVLAAWVLACSSAAQAGPHDVFGGLVGAVNQAHSGAVNTAESEEQDTANACATTASACYVSDVEPVVQQNCTVCHQRGLTADQQGARLLFTDDPASNHAALESFVITEGVGADWLLDKIIGDLGHGGGSVLAKGGDSYYAFADYLTLLIGANTDDGSVEASSIWSGTVIESPETTLRRAAILLAGKVPSDDAIKRAQSLKYGLKNELIALMEGEGFHDFVISGANDKLLSRGLTSGIDFQFDFWGRFPAFAEFAQQLPNERPEEFDTEEYWNRLFLTRNQADNAFRVSVVQEPLELIAHIVESDKNYKEVLTADYTMVTPISALAYRSDTRFEAPLTDDQGFFDVATLRNFKPGKNRGHIPQDQDSYFDNETGEFRFSEYQDWPHAGILSTPAWLGRFPSTDTNRNRARARWTYYHFLGVDIEKSAPRSTDAAALADTNNPTMNNPACTVCHARMDPVAGAYQSFGDQGHYLDQWGGMDSLPESYKRPEAPVGEVHELVHDVSVSDTYKVSKRRLSARVANGGGSFTINDISPRGCIQDQNNEDNWWCSHMGVKRVTVLKGGFIRRRINAHEFESDDRFSVDSWVDEETGESHPRGWLEENGTDSVYFTHTNAWTAFNFDLSPGDYELEVELVSKLSEGHPEPSITVSLAWTDGFNDSEGYQYGDTWYRDMRTPGFESKAASGTSDSIQWLAQEIVNDPRFAKATVAFWWPAIYGAEPLARPENSNLPNYGADLAAYNAQQTAMDELAVDFASSGFRARQLFASMILHPWYRTHAVSNVALSAEQEIALATVGSGRLLTPEELDRKNRGVLGRTWGEDARRGGDVLDYLNGSNLSAGWWGSYATFYGGIDAATVTKRNRNLTPLMANVSQRMAVDLACQAVVADFAKTREQRTIFTKIPRASAADLLLDVSFELPGQVPVTDSWPGEWFNHPVVSADMTLVGGRAKLRIADLTRGSYNSTDGEPSNADLIIQEIVIRSISSGETLAIDGADLSQMSDVVIDTYSDDEGQAHPRGDFHADSGGFWLHENAWIELLLNLPAGNYEVELTLATSLTENNVNDAIVVGVTALAVDNIDDTASSEQIKQQMTQLLHNATTRKPSDAEVEKLVEALHSYAKLAQGWGSDFNNVEGGCQTRQIWLDQQYSDSEWQLRFEDRDGMMRAWTMIISGLLTSYTYLHD